MLGVMSLPINSDTDTAFTTTPNSRGRSHFKVDPSRTTVTVSSRINFLPVGQSYGPAGSDNKHSLQVNEADPIRPTTCHTDTCLSTAGRFNS
jgi:hypothetical protein